MPPVDIEMPVKRRNRGENEDTEQEHSSQERERIIVIANGVNNDDSDDDDDDNDDTGCQEKASLITITGEDAKILRDRARQQSRSLMRSMLFPLLMPLSLLLLALTIGYLAMTHRSIGNSKSRQQRSPYQIHTTMHGPYPQPFPYSHYMVANTSIRLDLPLRDTLIQKNNERNDGGSKHVLPIVNGKTVDWVIDFAIIGYPKCGTSSVKHWLSRSPSVFMDDDEVHSMAYGNPDRLVINFYNYVDKVRKASKHKENGGESNNNKDANSLAPLVPLDKMKFGIKNPADIDSVISLRDYRQYYPKTRFIVQLRHPVRWFESCYNFRLRNSIQRFKKYPLNPHKLLGSCKVYHYNKNESYSCAKPWDHIECKPGGNCCTDRAQFHKGLSRLGLTPMNTTEELDLLDHHGMSIYPTSQPVFLLELTQLSDRDTKASLRQDLSAFLGINDLPPMGPYNIPYTKEESEIDICEDRYRDIREVLVRHGTKASTWIQNYLLYSPQVVVSSRERFFNLVDLWKRDPCINK